MPGSEWDSPSPDEAPALLEGCPAPWWISGGWAIDLFLGEQTRRHADLDVGCFRDELPGFLASFEGWDVAEARDGALDPLSPGSTARADTTSLWMRPAPEGPWVLEVLPECRAGTHWVYRRDGRVRRDAGKISSVLSDGLTVLRPEIQLLYKSKGLRARDEADFARALPRLAGPARDWLAQALLLSAPGHPWLGRLSGAPA